MTKKVIEYHEPPVYQNKCHSCKSVFQYTEEDVVYIPFSIFDEVRCPVCGTFLRAKLRPIKKKEDQP